MKKLSVTHAKLYASISAELELAEKYDHWIENLVYNLTKNISFNDENTLPILRFDQHCRDIHLERAAAMLEIVGLFNPEEQSVDLGTLNTIRQSIELEIKEQNVI